MNIFIKILSGLFGAFLGILLALILQLTIGNGLDFTPLSLLLKPILVGASVGFIAGYIFNKFVKKVFVFLSHFLN
ncbi:MAG: hypothetical protein V3V19_10870 [Cocleimonas sp.]